LKFDYFLPDQYHSAFSISPSGDALIVHAIIFCCRGASVPLMLIWPLLVSYSWHRSSLSACQNIGLEPFALHFPPNLLFLHSNHEHTGLETTKILHDGRFTWSPDCRCPFSRATRKVEAPVSAAACFAGKKMKLRRCRSSTHPHVRTLPLTRHTP
jgi:hypothetical protein